MVDIFEKYYIVLGNYTSYHPQGNGLVESSNKYLINIIKNVLEVNKKKWHAKLINDVWVDRVSTKKSIGMFPFQLVYGIDIFFVHPLLSW